MNQIPQRWSLWLLAGFSLLGFAGWEIAQISVKNRGAFGPRKKVLSPPSKVRSDGRMPPPAESPVADPVTAYLEAAKRGMTEREVRWLVEDFNAQGFLFSNLPANADARTVRAFRNRQQSWYLAALTGALHLTPDQRKTARERFATQLEKDSAVLVTRPVESLLGDIEVLKPIAGNIDAVEVLDPSQWLFPEAMAPWNLCDLSEAQASLTLKDWASREKRERVQDPTVAPDEPLFIPWMSTELAGAQDPVSGNRIEAAATNPPLLPRTDILPLTPGQLPPAAKEEEEEKAPMTVAEQARRLMPAQLRLALLLHPELASQLSEPAAESAAAPPPPAEPQPEPGIEPPPVPPSD